MFGVLLIDKPLGITSHDVVQMARRRLGTRRVGHSGTLDPLATGLLVLAVGPATRFLQYLPLEPKVYRGTIRFGVVTNTQDREGEVLAENPVPDDLEDRLPAVIASFSGLVSQLPPMYSAVKKEGKALYDYARRGEVVERAMRTVHIEKIDVLSCKSPDVEVRIECSGGTYIRTLAHDIGIAVGCGAHLAQLHRERVGKFVCDDATSPAEIESNILIPLSEALPPMPLVGLNEVQEDSIREGRQIGTTYRGGQPLVGLLGTNREVVGVARVVGELLQPECVIPRGGVHGSV